MNVDDLIRLLNNRLREFKLSRDYATMSGDLERVVAADKEIIALEDTLFKLSLLADASQSAAVKETTLAEVITDGSVAVLDEYDITLYATDPLHEEKIMNLLSKMGVMDTVEKIEGYIRGKYVSSPVTGEMVMSAALAYSVDARLMMAIMEQDSRFGTVGLAVSTTNPGNVGNDDDGNTRTYESWQEGVTAVAEWLNRHRGSTIIPEIPDEIVAEPVATSTPEIATSTSSGQATSTSPFVESTTATSTSPFSESTTATSTSPFVVSTTTVSTAPETATSTSSPEISSGQATSTSAFITSTTTVSTAPETATSTSSPEISSPQFTTTP